MIGRDEEIGEILNLAAAHRLITLTGAGGIGKTRLALALAGSKRSGGLRLACGNLPFAAQIVGGAVARSGRPDTSYWRASKRTFAALRSPVSKPSVKRS